MDGHEVCSPLYGHPASARCLHYTLDKFMCDSVFHKTGFEESVRILHADEPYPHTIYMSAHIDDTVIMCEDPKRCGSPCALHQPEIRDLWAGLEACGHG